ncbi:hypothetical protein BJ508DRAFT_322334 [Ascobolus immersus RN42]|uniref:F-box domain-containing protein n=1 Tax=Ascobolus immersus RN42 TaxID=1160509 RepID=A0A3N4INF5_ASCIM|nr:hypothetical protein BJ508DRAFT_322334 [Ascobolus immersus RN42]
MSSHDQTNYFPIFRLPPEVRLEIYECCSAFTLFQLAMTGHEFRGEILDSRRPEIVTQSFGYIRNPNNEYHPKDMRPDAKNHATGLESGPSSNINATDISASSNNTTITIGVTSTLESDAESSAATGNVDLLSHKTASSHSNNSDTSKSSNSPINGGIQKGPVILTPRNINRIETPSEAVLYWEQKDSYNLPPSHPKVACQNCYSKSWDVVSQQARFHGTRKLKPQMRRCCPSDISRNVEEAVDFGEDEDGNWRYFFAEEYEFTARNWKFGDRRPEDYEWVKVPGHGEGANSLTMPKYVQIADSAEELGFGCGATEGFDSIGVCGSIC